jgi:hypothetical protein
MHLVYIDEVKHDPPAQPYHWLCALAFPESTVQAVDAKLSEIAERFFGTSVLDPANEFHARHILQGKGPFKGRAMESRVELFNWLLDVIGAHDIGRIEIRLDPAKMIATRYKDMAFMFLVEKIDDYMRQCKSIALLIADEDRELAGTNVTSLSSYKRSGTQYAFAKSIRHIVDTIHHTRSHHSRLLQLADIYVYTLAMAAGDHGKYPRSKIVEHARRHARVLFPTKYKNWPTASSWYKRQWAV